MKKIFVAAIAVLMLGACAQFQQGVAFTKDRVDGYCASTTPLERETLRTQLAYEDGSPRIVVYCEPHGEAPTT